MPKLFRALRHRDFRLYVAGQIISLTGTWMQSLALSWLVYRLTKSTLLMGTVGFATHIPVLLLGPLGGLVADRFPRRRTVILMQGLLMCQALAMAALTYTGVIEVWMITLLALSMGAFNAFEIPARQSLYVHMVGKEDLLDAIANADARHHRGATDLFGALQRRADRPEKRQREEDRAKDQRPPAQERHHDGRASSHDYSPPS